MAPVRMTPTRLSIAIGVVIAARVVVVAVAARADVADVADLAV